MRKQLRRKPLPAAILLVLALPAASAAESVQQQPAKTEKQLPEAQAAPAATGEAAAREVEGKMLGTVVVSASRSEREIDLTPKPVTVITRDEIIARGITNIQQVLEDTPGISYSRSGGLGGQLVVRGVNSNEPRMVLFIDGDRFRGRNNLEYNLLDPSEIERIEIIRGPASALYGSDAMTGVVNVITRRAKGDVSGDFKLTPRIAALGYASTNDFFGGRVELQGLGNGVDALLGVNRRSAENYDSPAGEIPNSDFDASALTARIGFSADADRRFEILGRLNRTESGRAGGIGGAPGAPLLTVREDPHNENYVRLGYTHRRPTTWLDGLDVSLYRRDLNTTVSNENRTAANGDTRFTNQYVDGPTVYGGKVIGSAAIGKTLLTYGTDFYYEDRKGSENDARTVNAAGTQIAATERAKRNRDATQLNVGAFANADWDPSPVWTVSASGRYDTVRGEVESTPAIGENAVLMEAFDRNQQSKDQAVTGAVGLIFHTLPQLDLVANVANAFRAPAIIEQFSGSVIGATTTIPNPDLEPERSVNYELGFRVRLPAFRLNVTGFRSDFEDLIQTVTVDTTTRQRQNTGTAEFTGVELDGSYTLTRVTSIRFNASRVRGTNTQTQTPIAYLPPLNGLLALRYTPGPYFAEIGVRAYQAKTRIDLANERPTPGFATLNISAGVDLARFSPALKGYRLSVGVDNLFNREYINPATQENIAFPRSSTNPLLEPGRSVLINLAGSF